MKKIFLFLTILLAVSNAHAQTVRKNAIGLRLGDNDGFGGEISYQRGLSDNNRLELDLGLRDSRHYDAVKLAALYQWIWNIDGGFNWYAGAGGGIGSWRYSDDFDGRFNNDIDDGGTFLFIAGDIGIEYVFDIPLLIALDLRPELYLADDRDNFDSLGPDIAIAVRFTF